MYVCGLFKYLAVIHQTTSDGMLVNMQFTCGIMWFSSMFMLPRKEAIHECKVLSIVVE